MNKYRLVLEVNKVTGELGKKTIADSPRKSKSSTESDI
jgi:hypothetical protein